MLNPSNGSARVLRAGLLIVRGEPEVAIEEALRARSLDPLNLLVNTGTGYTHYRARRFEAALEAFHHTLTLDRAHIGSRMGVVLAGIALGRLDVSKGALDAAEAHGASPEQVAIRRAYRCSGGGLCLGERLARESASTSTAMAALEVALGEHDRAPNRLESAAEERKGDLIYSRRNVMFDPLVGDPRFEELLNRIGI